jgi:hypothetical protein
MENERENGERKECENITDECKNKEESDGKSKNDHYSKSFVDNSKNKQNRESGSIIMENKHIENSDIAKSEKEDGNEQIQNGGVFIASCMYFIIYRFFLLSFLFLCFSTFTFVFFFLVSC